MSKSPHIIFSLNIFAIFCCQELDDLDADALLGGSDDEDSASSKGNERYNKHGASAATVTASSSVLASAPQSHIEIFRQEEDAIELEIQGTDYLDEHE